MTEGLFSKVRRVVLWGEFQGKGSEETLGLYDYLIVYSRNMFLVLIHFSLSCPPQKPDLEYRGQPSLIIQDLSPLNKKSFVFVHFRRTGVGGLVSS